MSPAAPSSGPRSRTPLTSRSGLRSEPPNSTRIPRGERQRQHGSGRCAARTIHSPPWAVNREPNDRSVGLAVVRGSGADQSGQGVSAPAIGRQRRFGWRAAVASSRRRTGAVCGAELDGLGIASRPPPRWRCSASAKASSVSTRLGLGRLDEHALVDDQREVDRRRVEAVVDEALGDVQRAHAGPLP